MLFSLIDFLIFAATNSNEKNKREKNGILFVETQKHNFKKGFLIFSEEHQRYDYNWDTDNCFLTHSQPWQLYHVNTSEKSYYLM